MAEKRRILVAPLDWGLGHATRCIPLIRALLARGHDVVAAARGAAKILLAEEFPQLIVEPIVNYNITYASTIAGFYARLPWMALRTLYCARRERVETEALVRKHHIDCVISDNRFGAHARGVRNVYLTHQVCVRLPRALRCFSRAAYLAHRAAMAPFDLLWIPDRPGPGNLTGELSGKYALPGRARYIGLLSRFAACMPADERQEPPDLLVAISGPEPQRSLLEQRIRAQLKDFSGRAVVVLGKPGAHQERRVEGNVCFMSHLSAPRLHALMRSARAIVCRGGYTTIMELASLNRSAILVPTPGQTEQQYLCDRMARQGRAVCVAQHLLHLPRALQALQALPEVPALPAHALLEQRWTSLRPKPPAAKLLFVFLPYGACARMRSNTSHPAGSPCAPCHTMVHCDTEEYDAMEHITESECIRIGLAGNLTEVEMARLCGRARALAPCGVRRVELDFSKVSYIGSSALGGLVYLHHLFGKRGVTLVVVAPLPEVLQELQTCGLAGLLRVQAAA